MSFSINRASRHVLHDYNSMKIHGVPGLSTFGFALTLEGDKGKFEEGDLISLKEMVLHLTLANGWHIATAFPQQYPRADMSPYNSTPLHFFFELSGNAIEKIEQYRAGADFLKIQAKFGCIVYEPNEKSFDKREHVVAQSGAFMISSQEWLKAKEQSGYRKSLFLEIGIPELDNEQYKKLKNLIQQTQQHLANGFYDSAITNCRKILEALHYKDTSPRPDLRKLKSKFSVNHKEMTAIERLQLCEEAIKLAANLGPHGDHDEDYSRNQAHAIFGMVLSIASCNGLRFPVKITEVGK